MLFKKILKIKNILHIAKLLDKAKLKSLPYSHTDHPVTPNFKSSLKKSIQVLHQHMRYEVSLELYTQGLFI